LATGKLFSFETLVNKSNTPFHQSSMLLLLLLQLNMATFEEGEHVKTAAGSHEKNACGAFLGPCGKASWKIRVDGDSQAHGNLWKSPIAPVVNVEASQEEDARLPREEDDGLPKEMVTWTKAMKEVEPPSRTKACASCFISPWHKRSISFFFLTAATITMYRNVVSPSPQCVK